LSVLKDFWPLTKPTITLLVVVTVVPGLLLASSTIPDPIVALAALIGTYLASASASVFNHLLDADLDQVMHRTRGRPLPSGQVSSEAALIFGGVLGAASLAVLYVFTTPLAAAVAFAANVFYVAVYTLCLKRHTDQNIVIGGAAGAVGPLIGWAAVTGSIGWPAWVLFLVIFLWTPPHFWALAIKYKQDYAAAGVPMMPVSRGDDVTRWQMFLYTLTLIPTVASLTIFGSAGWIYLIPSMAATLYFSWRAWRLWRTADNQHAMPLFHYSCLYLFVIFGALTFDRLVALTA
jgi:protoheme IX farnesyltransferase